MSEATGDPPLVEVITDSCWISGHLSREQSSDAANLATVLNLGDYGLSGRGLLESGRLVDILNRDAGYVSVTNARVEPLFPVAQLDRTVAKVAVRLSEILCAAPVNRPNTAPSAALPTEPGRVERELRRIEVQAGPILVQGDLHVAPGSDPVAAFFRREVTFIPLTSASAIYLPEPSHQWTRDVLIVNMRRSQLLFVRGDQDPPA